MTDVGQLAKQLRDRMGTVIVGNEALIDLLTVTLLARGHVLLTGPPGVAKSTMGSLFAGSTGLEYSRIQMTPDLLPAAITGKYVYRESTGEYEFHRGPVFSNIVLVDEINRAPPKTQSALLEAMQELQVTIEGETHPLPSPFMMIGTRGPRDMDGVFDLPEAQRDRFLFELRVGLVGPADERAILDRFDQEPTLRPDEVSPVVDPEEITGAREVADAVHVAPEVKDYILDLFAATRELPDVSYGASTRAAILLLHASKALAAVRGRDYVIPDDLKSLIGPVLRHRLILTDEANLNGIDPDDLVRQVVEDVNPPGTDFGLPEAVAGDGDSA